MAQPDPGPGQGELHLVSLGPGGQTLLTPAARQALERAEAVLGYRTYLELLPADLLQGKRVLAWAMRQEVERVQEALSLAGQGLRVALVGSGDVGVYSLAGLALEVARARGLRLAFQRPARAGELAVGLTPGISALNAAAALLGAPLSHDFMALSLSDLLTPWPTIVKRLRAAAEADLVLCLYNPRSRKRDWQLEEVRRIMLERRSPQTPVGVARNAFRPGQEVWLTSLAELDVKAVDMLCLVIVGNSETIVWEGLMITPRGYESRYELE